MKPKMRIVFSIILLGIFLSQCEKSEQEDSSHIKPDQIINLVESSNLSRYSLTCTDSELIATDTESNKIYIFDYKTSEIVETFGRNGRGPGEFNGALNSVVVDENVYVYDTGNQRISVFDKKSYLLKSVIPVSMNVSRFVVSSDYIYLSSPFTRIEQPFMKVNMDGDTEFFGEKLEYDFFGRNIFHLLIYEEKIIAVSLTEPIIKFYNKVGELLVRYDLLNETQLTETLEFTNQFYLDSGNQNRTVVLFNDASIFDDYLILNLNTRPGGRLKSNNYLVYKIDGNTLNKVDFFETNLGDGGFTMTFCIHENKLYSNGGSSGIDIYRFDLSFLTLD